MGFNTEEQYSRMGLIPESRIVSILISSWPLMWYSYKFKLLLQPMRKSDIFHEQVTIAVCRSIQSPYQANFVTELGIKLHIISKELTGSVGV